MTEIFGLLNIDKPGGYTSHDVVEAVRKATGLQKVGHAGTLDPMATGVLVLCLGAATRLSEYIMGQPKTYEATLRLGQTTDTYDADGMTTSENPTQVERTQLETVLPQFQAKFSKFLPCTVPSNRAAKNYMKKPVAVRKLTLLPEKFRFIPSISTNLNTPMLD